MYHRYINQQTFRDCIMLIGISALYLLYGPFMVGGLSNVIYTKEINLHESKHGTEEILVYVKNAYLDDQSFRFNTDTGEIEEVPLLSISEKSQFFGNPDPYLNIDKYLTNFKNGEIIQRSGYPSIRYSAAIVAHDKGPFNAEFLPWLRYQSLLIYNKDKDTITVIHGKDIAGQSDTLKFIIGSMFLMHILSMTVYSVYYKDFRTFLLSIIIGVCTYLCFHLLYLVLIAPPFS